ncbi:sugar ABC transporter substrate-binding protein [Burkholderia multivorans]|jgi:inositol transport system substrate-binding protein|uniref:Periplasmic binding protein/LacI transcriptional regulator n=1 Tax=Burkholderia multivorans TaxID=87883 RepID=A0A1W0YDL3_9BURK|nr:MULTISPECIES: sugar ABC transporter substrate-binding protein [Burkholderia]AIO76661.1 periplasmic binding s and sugar binding domain of LacI family protein [Burkholderia multivorans]AJY18995.1 periplasmic binding domain protein [Burkholderia multivorans ATCC BAA-247]AOK67343.1 rhizopine-binding protein [Burkholderia multivorans]AVR21889.1 rhizopine-binding protein [Burkholderia multivorans]KGC03018.1 periplasmic binding s and sugar binding domain of LacI family protein [Burkholderia multiv
MKTKLMAVAAAAMLAMPLAHAEKIGVTMASFDDTFLTILRNSIADAAKKDGATVQIEDAGNDVGKQLSQVQNMIAQKVDAIIVNAVDTDATPKITKMVTAAKIPLVYVNRKPVDFDKLPAGVAVVASDEKQSGTLQARQVCKLLGGKGDLLVLMGELSNESARARTKDIEDVIATKDCAGMRIVDKREGKWSRTQGQDITMNWLSSGMKFDAIVSNNDEMAIGAINALKAARKWTPKTIVAGIDATPDGLASMKSGELKVSVYQNASGQGTQAVAAALKLAKKQNVDRYVNVPFELVTPDNMNQYAKH